MLIVLKHDHARRRDVCVNADGTTTDRLDDGELFTSRDKAQLVADLYGGSVVDESRLPNWELDDHE